MRMSGGMHHGMGYNMRGGGQQPQPQRQRQRNNNRFRGSRFDPHRQPQQNQNQNQNQRPKEQIKPQEQSKPPQQIAKPVQQQPQQQQPPKPQQQQQQPPPKPQPVPAPVVDIKPVITQPAVQTPVQQQANKPTLTPANSQTNINKPNEPAKTPIQNQAAQNMNKTPVQNTMANKGNLNQQGGNLSANKGNINQAGNNFNKGGIQNRPQGNGPQGGNNQNRQQQQGNGPQGNQNRPQGNGPQGGANLNRQQGAGPQQGNKGNMGQGGNANNAKPAMGAPRGNMRRFPDKMGGPGNRDEHFMMSKLKEISGPTIDLPPLEQVEQKFSGRNRLYIGNLTNDVTEEEVLEMFSPYGETSELFINKEKNFAFIRIDYKMNAEKAKREVDGRMRRGRPLRVRFAPHNAAVKVKNLTPFVSNELLYRSFEIFGKIERAYVRVDERGKSLGEGIVEFTRKSGALNSIRHCTEKCFFLTASLRPVVVESFEEVDELDGYAEKSLMRKNQDYARAREIGPRFAEADSFEHEYGTRWKQLHELYKQKEDSLHREMHMEEDKLEAQMEYAKYEHETEMLREQLRQREQDTERQKRTWEMAERHVEERREKERENILRQQEDMAQRMRHQEDELRRRQQENTLFMQAQQLSRILDEEEQGMGGGRGYDNSVQDKRGNGPSGSMSQMDAQYLERFDTMGGHMGYDDGMGRWESRQEDYPNKRRRY